MFHEAAAISDWEVVRNKKCWPLALASWIRICGVGAKNVYVLTSYQPGASTFGISGPHWKKKSCLGSHIKYININENWWAKKKVLSKCMILCWATSIAILGHGLDTPARTFSTSLSQNCWNMSAQGQHHERRADTSWSSHRTKQKGKAKKKVLSCKYFS